MIVITHKNGKKIAGIYAIQNLKNSKIYIGRTSSLYDRKIQHETKLKTNNHVNEHLQKAWNKYGAENFVFYIVEICDKALLLEKEEFYIDFYKSHIRDFGYNLQSFINGSYIVSEETKEKISKAHKGIKPTAALAKIKELTLKGKNPNIGLKHSEETKEKMSNSAKGRIPKKALLKIKELIKEGKNPYKGRIITQETIDKMLNTKSKWTEEEKLKYSENISNGLKNRLYNGQEKKCALINSDNCIVNEYNSIVELVKSNSELGFNVTIVGRICRGKRKNPWYKNYTFKFI